MNWSRVAQSALLIALLLVVGAFVVQAFPDLVGADHSLIVQSGSMEPAIGTGSVVFVTDIPPEQAVEGDVITFQDDGGNLVTHRVHEKYATENSLRFVTKGDANEGPDPEPVYRGDYVGTVPEVHLPLIGTLYLSIPFMGYVLSFANTGLGWLVLVVVPLTLLVFNELWSLYRAMEPVETTDDE